MAGERADRSIEFSDILPLSPLMVILSKAFVALGFYLVAGLVNLSLLYLATSSTPTHVIDTLMFGSGSVRDIVWDPAILVALVFGVSWLVSAVQSRPAMGAVSGLASLFIPLMITPLIISKTSLSVTATFFLWPVIGIACFISGVAYHMRRVSC